MKSTLVLNPTLNVNVQVDGRVRNAVRSPWVISGVDKPVLMRLIADLLSGVDPRTVLAGAPANVFEHLKKLGVIVERGEEPTLPVFEHALDEDVLGDVAPSAQSHAQDLDPDTLVLSPRCRILSGEKGRAAARAIPFLYPMSGRRSSVWVQDSGTGARLVYGLSREWTKCLTELHEGRLSARVLDPQRRAVLVHAGLLVPRRRSMAPKVGSERDVRGARASIQRDGYAVLRSVLPPYFMALVRRHYRRLREEGFFAYDREQVKRMRCYMHNEPVTRFVHAQLAPLFARAAGKAIKPSYSIVTEYFAGARLPKHTDREQCEWNVTLLADPLPVFEGCHSWPICLEVKGRPLPVHLNIGDALVYQGTRTPHWRNRLEKGRTCKVVLFHFVHRDFEGSLD
jgi:hypothetical protein